MNTRPHPIFCIPHAGAGASVFRGWQQRAAAPLMALGLPGREAAHRDPCLRSIHDMAAYAVASIRRQGLRAATLFGHSMGALVAYEAACRLQQEDPGAVRRVVVSGCRGPMVAPPLLLSGIDDDDAFMDAVAQMGGMPPETAASEAVWDYLLPILRADISAVDGYHSRGEPLRVPLTALGAHDDPFVTPAAVAAWGEVAAAGFEPLLMGGGHFFVFHHADAVLALLHL
ncbi:thioesterase II family protein [Roseateles sp. P5_D6]